MFAELLWVDPDQLVAGGSSSLTMMHDVLVQHLLHGGVDSPRPWKRRGEGHLRLPRARLRPALHDARVVRHRDGDRADARRRPGRRAPSRRWSRTTRRVKGMWIVPTYANPAGSVVTQEVASRLASMPTAAPDFRIFWDNAYAFHHLTEDEAKSRRHPRRCPSAAGHPHRPVMFASTTKITYAGAGVAFLARLAGDRRLVPRPPAVRVDRARTRSTSCGTLQLFGSAQGVRDHMAGTARSSRRSSPRSTRR